MTLCGCRHDVHNQSTTTPTAQFQDDSMHLRIKSRSMKKCFSQFGLVDLINQNQFLTSLMLLKLNGSKSLQPDTKLWVERLNPVEQSLL